MDPHTISIAGKHASHCLWHFGETTRNHYGLCWHHGVCDWILVSRIAVSEKSGFGQEKTFQRDDVLLGVLFVHLLGVVAFLLWTHHGSLCDDLLDHWGSRRTSKAFVREV